MGWQELTSEAQFRKIIERSAEKPQLIFKHSTRCSVSFSAKRLLDSNLDRIAEVAEPVYLDLISFRLVSNLIAEELEITHQSPQTILLKNKQVVLHGSHFEIDPDEIIARAQS